MRGYAQFVALVNAYACLGRKKRLGVDRPVSCERRERLRGDVWETRVSGAKDA